MHLYVNFPTLAHRTEQKEAAKRVKEAKRVERLDHVKYYQAWERLTPVYEKWGTPALEPPIPPTDSTNPAGSLHQTQRIMQLEARRLMLKELFDREDAEYQRELQELAKNRPVSAVSNGITAKFVGQTEKPRVVQENPEPGPSARNRTTVNNGNHNTVEEDEDPPDTDNITSPTSMSSTGINHQNQTTPMSTTPLPTRRENLKQLFQTDQLAYKEEIGKNKNDSRVQLPTGITKNETAFKRSDDYSNRNAFLSGNIKCRRREELSHYRVFPSPSPKTNSQKSGASTIALQIGVRPRTACLLPTTPTVVPQTAVISTKDKPAYSVFRFW